MAAAAIAVQRTAIHARRRSACQKVTGVMVLLSLSSRLMGRQGVQVAVGVAFVEHATGDGGGAVEDRWAASAPAGRVSLENGAPTGGVEDADRRAGAHDDQAGYGGHGGENGPAADPDAPERRAHVVRVVCRQ